MPSLIGKILINKVLPSRKEILSSAGNLLKEAVKNPKKAFKEGMARDKAATAIYKGLTGKGKVETAKQVIGKVVKGGYKGGGKDLIVNTGGAIGSGIGASAGGTIGRLGGDYLGAGIARRAIDDIEILGSALREVRNTTYKQSWWRKGKLVQRRSKELAKRKRKESLPEYHKDAIGWGIGNASAESLQKAGSHIPLQGGIVAMNTVDPVYHGIKVGKRLFRQNKDQDIVRKATVSAGRRIRKQKALKKRIAKGNEREKIMYDSINNELKYLPTLPKEINFKRKTKLVNFNRDFKLISEYTIQ